MMSTTETIVGVIAAIIGSIVTVATVMNRKVRLKRDLEILQLAQQTKIASDELRESIRPRIRVIYKKLEPDWRHAVRWLFLAMVAGAWSAIVLSNAVRVESSVWRILGFAFGGVSVTSTLLFIFAAYVGLGNTEE